MLKYAHGFLQSIATFIGVAAGWILAIILGNKRTKPYLRQKGSWNYRHLFAWGKPSFDLGITITCVIGATVLLSMCFASIDGMAKTLGEEEDKRCKEESSFMVWPSA